MSGAPDITQFLPPSLNLPPHLSAHKYFFVCTLTVAAWDTLVLSPRTWRLLRSPEWPLLKVIYHIMRLLMPIEFIIAAVAFFDTAWTAQMCDKFYLFEPITTAILLALCGVSHAVRVSAIYDKSTTVLVSLSAGVLAMSVAMSVGAAFHHPVPLLEGQGCIAGPKHTWVGIYWAASTLYFVSTFALAVIRSLQTLRDKRLGWWKLMLRDGLNLYGCIAIVQLINVLFWFIAKPTDDRDSVKTIATSMTAVLTVTMTLRIILSVKGTLEYGGSYAGMSTAGSASRPGTTHHISTRPQPGQGQRGGAGAGVVGTGATTGAMSLEDLPTGKGTRDWDDQGSQEVTDAKDQLPPPGTGVRVSIERGTAAAESFGRGYKN